MLVLTRKIDEQIKIGDDITITIIKLRNNQIRIGIDAPRDVRVLRGELEAAIEVNAGSESKTGKPAASEIRNDVVDGLMSADEMIAQGRSEASEVADAPEAPAAKVQIISGKIRKSHDRVTAMRAPLSDFFSAT
ncbi:carbon storage regulator CsrA [Neorhodopirellula pilleata]|uniref:Translational regulator CsrA n=1 Tax=Neorhodopirellula pilleata TaxID=2714738 RepID=A0A5C6A9U6_9BACT|nr:carbon storage regulator CsrA [Neorhodopirellula pilleata]TWT95103.1 Carbon storage regulator [Neorhodopirellula pilleata]